jgi:methionine synthase II (cobalamin-independent)
VLLARLAASVIEGNLAATRKAWSAARISEQEFMPPQAIAEAIEQLERVGVNFGKQEREVKLVLTELERSIRLPGN